MLCHIAGVPGYLHNYVVEEFRREFPDKRVVDLEEEFAGLREHDDSAEWKAGVEAALSAFDGSTIIIGNTHSHIDLKVRPPVKCQLKVFLSVDEQLVPAKTVEHYIDSYREMIVAGEFPIQQLKHEWISSHREKLKRWYLRSGYLYRNLDDAIHATHLMEERSRKPDCVYVARRQKVPQERAAEELAGAIGYTQEWLALVSPFEGLRKGFEIGREEVVPFLKEMCDGAVERLDTGVHLYKVKMDGFVPDTESVYKWISTGLPSVIQRRYVPNILERLKENGVKVLKKGSTY
jgi:hypothetical protein